MDAKQTFEKLFTKYCKSINLNRGNPKYFIYKAMMRTFWNARAIYECGKDVNKIFGEVLEAKE